MSLNARKGFVGPLGDDLPSIFPIVAAVVLFIGTLVYADSLIASKNKMLETRQAALGLSYLVTEKGLINKRADFEKITCEDHLKKYASSNGVRFLVTIKRYCENIKFYYPKDNPEPQEARLSPFYLEKSDNEYQGQTWAFCTNAENPPAQGLLELSKNEKEKTVVMSYPVAVFCPKLGVPTNGLGLINVIAWK